MFEYAPPVEGFNVGMRRVTAILQKLLSSRKLMLIGGTALILSVATSAAALLVGKDRILGLSYGAANGRACETLQTVNMRKNGATWIRKYIRMSDAPGIERVKTALRVAAIAYAESQPQLVQITVLDENGPELRSNMRGRTIAAQIVFIADPTSIPEDAGAHRFSAFFHDGAANADGLYYGLRIDLPYEDIEALALAQDTFEDCTNPDGDSVTSSGSGSAQPKPVPTNLGAILPKTHIPGAPLEPQEIEEEEEDGITLKDLLTSTPTAETASYFSFGYWTLLLFGKGPAVAEAAVNSHD